MISTSFQVGLLTMMVGQMEARDLECKKFSEIYTDGKTMCENMWGGAFTATDNVDAYTMDFYQAMNPNDAVTEALNLTHDNTGAPTDQVKCELYDPVTFSTYHSEFSTEQALGDFGECHQYHDQSCCTSDVAHDVDTLKNLYGSDYHWDRCGALSQSCENFFVEEACFYECDANTGLWRAWTDAQVADPDNFPDANTWEISNMPIMRSYCDDWFRACHDDYFCANSDGNFFDCALVAEAEAVVEVEVEVPTVSLPAIIIPAVVVVLVALALAFVIYRERQGKALFTSLIQDEPGEEVGLKQTEGKADTTKPDQV